ncbi:hypothetical protein QO010_003171 [Caulobacter ginsengisoli]|uniref:DUF4833 domain-containing protein n=1 Tax=Caulobacter ginsengisoli TaxID=400775 RepID=A0ABU0ITQ6_9CAUL|nr:hypothetical protein [Caulobacter ginsengisoli]MDQ0465384.1 hypothetical protein [Caulobacter ginsengisoli]
MILRILALVCGLLLGAGPAAATDSWQPYVNKSYGVSLQMPSPPQIKVETPPSADGQPTRRTLTVTAKPAENRYYMLRVDIFDLPRRGTPRERLNRTVDGLLTPDRGPVISRTETTVGGSPAIDIVFGPGEGGVYLRSRLINREDRLIHLTTASDSPPPLDRFFTEFAFIP